MVINLYFPIFNYNVCRIFFLTNEFISSYYSMSKNKKYCPVPFDQQPINEYKSLKESVFFAWSTNNLKEFIVKLIFLFILITFLSILTSLFFIDRRKFYLSHIIINISISTVIVEVILIRLFLGWSYVLKRLLSATVFYEESGWYDGQLWIKSSDNLIQDRLVGTYQLIPILNRIKKSLLIVSTGLLIETISLVSIYINNKLLFIT